ncbi:protein DGCR14-like protein [Leptotrombidium deliense]|uniref:Protein DGCR14-like protein n=1 Tax=Leptotrombidium deliense TaxID=299467 RepID=A0A443SDU1_9ACAR|nr:protein DGCR14-like protein [Leptotrombidium deliense]
MENSVVVFDASKNNKKRKRTVLDEDSFTSDMEKIIERDFFPDLPKMKECLDYQEALQKNDVDKLNELRLKWKDNNEEIIINSPSGFETPFEEPCECEDSSKRNDKSQEKEEKSNISKTNNLSLDEYLTKYTSEDNSSFDSIMEEAKQKHKDKYPWLYLDEKKETLKYIEGLQVPSIDEQAKQKQPKLLTWKYQNMNSIMYYPESVKLTHEEALALTKCERVAHENTRFKANPFNERLNAATIAEKAYLHAKENKGKIGVDGKELLPSDVHVNGYKFVSMTPTPNPAAMNSPLMTWGTIEGTPCRLDDTPMRSSMTPGTPQFKIPETPTREKIALSLTDKISKKKQDRKKETMIHMSNALRSPLILGSPRTPSERLSAMSSAAQNLATRKLGIHRNTDLMLRESYSPSPYRSPQALTPSESRSVGNRKKATDFF